MLSELDLLLDVTRRLEEAGLEYMLTGSMALNHYAQPRMTRDIDIVIALVLRDLEILPHVFGSDFYFSQEAARGAVRTGERPTAAAAALMAPKRGEFFGD